MKINEENLEKIYDITLESAFAKSKEVFIFELWDIWNFMWKEKSEEIRWFFMKNKIKVKQINNNFIIPLFSTNKDFINKVMSFRYITKDIFEVKKEIVIFDDKVAFYDKNNFTVIEDKIFANSQKQLFMSIWEQGVFPKLGFDYVPNHSYFNSIDIFVNWIQIIVWASYETKSFYKNYDKEKLTKYFEEILNKNKDQYKNTSYIISFIWWFEKSKMVDIWSFEDNFVDDKCWPLWDVQVYKDQEKCYDLSSSSWSTLIILWAEEKLRRQSEDLKSYLDWPIPKMPLEIVNGKEFFE